MCLNVIYIHIYIYIYAHILNFQAATGRNRIFNIVFFMIFSSCETYYTHSEYNEYLFYRMQITSASIADIFSSRCRPCPNFKAVSRASDEEISKNRLQIRNLRTLKYWALGWQISALDFFMMKNAENHVPGPHGPYPPLISPFGAATT